GRDLGEAAGPAREERWAEAVERLASGLRAEPAAETLFAAVHGLSVETAGEINRIKADLARPEVERDRAVENETLIGMRRCVGMARPYLERGLSAVNPSGGMPRMSTFQNAIFTAMLARMDPEEPLEVLRQTSLVAADALKNPYCPPEGRLLTRG